MRIEIQLETHAYCEEQLCDDVLDSKYGDDIQSCGIVGEETIIPLRKNRNPRLSYEYDEFTTLLDIEKSIYSFYGIPNHSVRIGFMNDGYRYWIDNENAKFAVLVAKYLDPDSTGVIQAGVYVCMDAGSILEEDGIRYYMNSRERGKHHEPHVHIRTDEHEAVLIITTGRLIGDFPSKLTKKARKRVRNNAKFFLEKWNTLTDGLKVDVNHALGLINY